MTNNGTSSPSQIWPAAPVLAIWFRACQKSRTYLRASHAQQAIRFSSLAQNLTWPFGVFTSPLTMYSAISCMQAHSSLQVMSWICSRPAPARQWRIRRISRRTTVACKTSSADAAEKYDWKLDRKPNPHTRGEHASSKSVAMPSLFHDQGTLPLCLQSMLCRTCMA